MSQHGQVSQALQQGAIPSSAYPTPAQRPLNSRLDCSRLQQQWHVSQPHWQDALRECLDAQH